MKIRIKFCWYDMWVGAYWSRYSNQLYICIIPMFPIIIEGGWRNWFNPPDGDDVL